MKNSDKLLTKSSKANKWYIPLIAILSFGGFVDASYLTISHFKGASLFCNLSTGCDQVTTSAYSTILGVPVAMLGLFFYLFTFILVVAYFDTKKDFLFKIILVLSALSFCFSLWFVGVMAFVIGAWCQYCLVSAVLSTTIFVASLFRYRLGRTEG
ncbi:MAG: vitamin K epoxide reductase family protein [Candidatus Paceibacterota bacterium]|jgi:uncharacterized membrane protein